MPIMIFFDKHKEAHDIAQITGCFDAPKIYMAVVEVVISELKSRITELDKRLDDVLYDRACPTAIRCEKCGRDIPLDHKHIVDLNCPHDVFKKIDIYKENS